MSLDDRLVKSGDIIGTSVTDAKGHKIGVIREVFVDRDAGIGRFVAVEPAGLFTGGKYHPLPWRLLSFDDKADNYTAAVAKDHFKDSPAYDRDQLSKTGYGWAEQVERYFAG